MLLAFLVNQIFQRCSSLFNQVWTKTKTKLKVWQVVRAIFMTSPVATFKELYIVIAAQFRVQVNCLDKNF